MSEQNLAGITPEADPESGSDPLHEPESRLSAKATGRAGTTLSAAEVEAAEDEAMAWARRANSC